MASDIARGKNALLLLLFNQTTMVFPITDFKILLAPAVDRIITATLHSCVHLSLSHWRSAFADVYCSVSCWAPALICCCEMPSSNLFFKIFDLFKLKHALVNVAVNLLLTSEVIILLQSVSKIFLKWSIHANSNHRTSFRVYVDDG